MSDAFLTVDQVEPVLVTYADPEGQARSFILRKMRGMVHHSLAKGGLRRGGFSKGA